MSQEAGAAWQRRQRQFGPLSGLFDWFSSRSTVGVLMCTPVILIIGVLVIAALAWRQLHQRSRA